MNLSDEDKKRIEEEEAYRQKIREEEHYRNQLNQDYPKKSGDGFEALLRFGVLLIFAFFAPGMIAYFLQINLGFGVLASLLTIILLVIWKSKLSKRSKYRLAGVFLALWLILNLVAAIYVPSFKSPTPVSSSPFPTSTPLITPNPPKLEPDPKPTEQTAPAKPVVNVKEIQGKRYSDLDNILGTSSSLGKPQGSTAGGMYWDKGDVHIETFYYNLEDKVQAISFKFNNGVHFSSYNDAFKLMGVDPIDVQPDKISTFIKKWHNIQGYYAIHFATGIDGSQAITILFHCNPDRLKICQFE